MRKGFTLLEMTFAVAVFALVMATAMGSWLLFMYKANSANRQADLDVDVRNVVEKFRSEMRNTARETILFYPPNNEPYAAVGFALASDMDGDGLMDMAPGGSNILWRQTVVYHVWNRSPYQMRKTVFSNRNKDATYAARLAQIESVVNSGDGSGACLPGESAKTDVLFSNLFTGKLWYADSRFDGYAPIENTREKTDFGSIQIGPGMHTVSFSILDKNPKASDMKLRLDQVTAGVSGWPMEAELSTAAGSVSAVEYVGQGLAGDAYGRTAQTAAVGDKLSLTLYNDAIEECAFIGEGRNVTFSNTVVRFDSAYRPAGFDNGVFAAKLDGQFKVSWWASVQASKAGVDAAGSDLTTSDLLCAPGTNCAVRIPVRGDYVRADGFGPVFRLIRSAYNNNLQILNPAYAPTETPDSPSITGTNFMRLAFYQNGVKKASWSACSAGAVDLRPDNMDVLQPVYVGQNYILSYQITVTDASSDQLRAFRLADNSWDCWMVKGGDAATAMQGVWPSYETLRMRDAGTGWRRCIPALVCMTVNYADNGTYISHVYDTKSDAGGTKTLQWTADVPQGSTLKISARSGNEVTADGFGIADAPAWENVPAAANGAAFSGSTGRYVQFRAAFMAQPCSQYPGAGSGAGSVGPYRSATPKIRRVLFTWDGEERYVDISASVLKSPDCGIFTVDVDGKKLLRGVTMEIEIFQNILTQGGVKATLRSAMTAEIDPRNSGK